MLLLRGKGRGWGGGGRMGLVLQRNNTGFLCDLVKFPVFQQRKGQLHKDSVVCGDLSIWRLLLAKLRGSQLGFDCSGFGGTRLPGGRNMHGNPSVSDLSFLHGSRAASAVSLPCSDSRDDSFECALAKAPHERQMRTGAKESICTAAMLPPL